MKCKMELFMEYIKAKIEVLWKVDWPMQKKEAHSLLGTMTANQRWLQIRILPAFISRLAFPFRCDWVSIITKDGDSCLGFQFSIWLSWVPKLSPNSGFCRSYTLSRSPGSTTTVILSETHGSCELLQLLLGSMYLALPHKTMYSPPTTATAATKLRQKSNHHVIRL